MQIVAKGFARAGGGHLGRLGMLSCFHRTCEDLLRHSICPLTSNCLIWLTLMPLARVAVNRHAPTSKWLQVSLQSLPCQLGVADYPGNQVLIPQPRSSKQTAALAEWLVQRIKGMKQVVLGHPQPRSILTSIPLPDPADNGSFSATRLALLLMSVADVEDSLEIAVFQLGKIDFSANALLRMQHCLSAPLHFCLYHFNHSCALVCCCFCSSICALTVLPVVSAVGPVLYSNLHYFPCTQAVVPMQIQHCCWMKAATAF